MSALLAQLEAAMEMSMESSNSRYRLDNDCTDTRVLCNRDSMVGALMNLVNNSIQAGPGGVELSIKVSTTDGEHIQIIIADNGTGIDEAVLANLNEPFFTTKAQGTGLGLSVVRAVAKAHHGEFNLYSKPGEGVTAILTLPIIKDAAPGNDASESSNCVSAESGERVV